MKALCKICLMLFILVSQTASAQNSLSLETSKDEHCTYIKPTFFNITKLLFASNEEYVRLMESYNYEKSGTLGEYHYYASSDEVNHYRNIVKESRILMMNFSPNNVNMVSTFRNDIKEVVKDAVVEYEDGYETYRVMIPYDGLKFKVLFRLKEETVTNTIHGRTISFNTGMVMAIIK